MKSNFFVRLAIAVAASMLLITMVFAQNTKQDTKDAKQTAKQDMNKGQQLPPDTGSALGAPMTQLSGVINSVSRHDTSPMFEIKIKDSSGKKREVSISPSAIIKQNDQKVANSLLVKGATVQIEAYAMPGGLLTAKTVTISSSPTATAHP